MGHGGSGIAESQFGQRRLLFGAEGIHGVDGGGAACGDERRRNGNGENAGGCGDEAEWIVGGELVEQRGHPPGG